MLITTIVSSGARAGGATRNDASFPPPVPAPPCAPTAPRKYSARARPPAGPLREPGEGGRAAPRRRGAEALLDAQELVVLGHAVAARGGAGLDLARVGRHRDV